MTSTHVKFVAGLFTVVLSGACAVSSSTSAPGGTAPLEASTGDPRGDSPGEGAGETNGRLSERRHGHAHRHGAARSNQSSVGAQEAPVASDPNGSGRCDEGPASADASRSRHEQNDNRNCEPRGDSDDEALHITGTLHEPESDYRLPVQTDLYEEPPEQGHFQWSE